MTRITFVFIFLFSFNAFANSITSSVSKNKIGFNEATTLTISLSKNNGSDPDFSLIEKDFQILRVNNFFNASFANGHFSQTIEYVLTLMPKSQGNLTIPSISIGNEKTQPIQITVTPNSQTADAQSNQHIITAKVEKNTAFVQEEINFTITVIDNGAIDFREQRFADNQDFIIKSLGQPSYKEVIEDGIKKRKTTFDFALFPQKSGELQIPMFELQGYESTNIQTNDPFMGIFASQSRPISLRTPAQKINIKKAPSNWKSKWWLPAQNLTLTDEFITKDFKINEPIKRKIIIQSKGLLENQLPEINFKDAKEIKQYPGKSQSHTYIDNKEIVAQKEIIHTYMATSDGNITLPSIEVEWFDVNSNQIKTATIAQKQIRIQGASPHTSSDINSGIDTNTNTITKTQAPKQNKPATTQPFIPQEEIKKQSKKTIHPIALVSISFIIGALLGFLLKSARKKTNLAKLVTHSKNAKELEKNLITWAQNKYANVLNLSDIARAVNDPNFSIMVQNLSQSLYNNKELKIKDFIKSFKLIANKKTRSAQKDTLPNLYK